MDRNVNILDKGNRRILVSIAFLYIAYTLTSFFKVSANIVMPIYQERFGLTSSFVGLISSMYYISYAVMQLVTGPLCRKHGPLKVLGVSFLVAVVGSICFAFAQNSVMVLMGRLLVGFGVGPVFVANMAYLSQVFDGHQFAKASGLSVGFSGLGGLCASAPLKALISRFGITPVFVGLTVLLAFVSFMLISLGMGWKKGEGDGSGIGSIFRQIGDGCCKIVHSWVLVFACLLWMYYNAIHHSYQGLWCGSWWSAAFPSFDSLCGLTGSIVSLGMIGGTVLSEYLRKSGDSRTKTTIQSEVLDVVSVFLLVITHNPSLVGLSEDSVVAIVFCLISDFIAGFAVGHICTQLNSYTKDNCELQEHATILGFMNFCSSMASVLFQWSSGLGIDICRNAGMDGSAPYSVTYLVFAFIGLAVLIPAICIQKRKEVLK